MYLKNDLNQCFTIFLMNIFIHRRDLRINDNNSLINLAKNCNNINPIFIFNPEQIFPEKNQYFSNNLVEFMCDSLKDLHNQYKKYNIDFMIFEGDIIDVLNSINNTQKIKSLGFNKDYSPFSKKRDTLIKSWCKKNKIKLINEEDMLLVDISSKKSINPNSKKPYHVFSPFLKNMKKTSILKPIEYKPNFTSNKIISKYKIKLNDISKYYKINSEKHVSGNRNQALDILKNISKLDEYNKLRGNLNYSTSNLSAFINMGIVSIREVYHTIMDKLGSDSLLLNELYWRDFYYNILYYYPDVVKGSFKKKYDKLNWENDENKFTLWKEGKTGFPVVDACMRQLNKTGYMHNRGRMIVSSFLTKDLHIDWRWGEKYFANKLIDYNISANNGGWQWTAGTGTDSQPYFRIFNPWTQSANYDNNCNYIKKWIPELKDIDNKIIHNWNKYYIKYPDVYLKPIIDHSESRKKTLLMYKNV